MNRSNKTLRQSMSIVKIGLMAVVLAAAVFTLPSAHAQPLNAATIVSPQEPGSLLPHFDLLTLTHEVERLLYSCLITNDAAGEFLPQLAVVLPTVENGGISPDGTTYTFNLRDDVTWHDGEPFTSADVEFTWRIINDQDLPIVTRSVWEDIVSVETPDETTVIFTFPNTNVNFLETAASDSCFILPQHLLEGTDIANSTLHREPVGTGPFVFEEWQSGSFISVVKNPEFYQEGLPRLDRITIQFIPGTAGQRALLERGDVDLQLDLTTSDFEFVRDLEDYEVVTAPFIAFWQLWLNNEDPILSDINVRRALEHAVDKLAISEELQSGLTEPLDAVLPQSHWAHNPDVAAFGFDLNEANQLLENAGWIRGNDGIREKDGERLSLEIINIAGQAERLLVVQFVQSLWREIGVEVRIREIEGASFPPTLSSGDFQVAYGLVRRESGAELQSLGRYQLAAIQQSRGLRHHLPSSSYSGSGGKTPIAIALSGDRRVGCSRHPDHISHDTQCRSYSAAGLFTQLVRKPLECRRILDSERVASNGTLYIEQVGGGNSPPAAHLCIAFHADSLCLRAGPADIYAADPRVSQNDIERLNELWGLNQPLHVQYLQWLGNAISGNWGWSYSESRPVFEAVTLRIPNTLLLAGGALIFAIVVGLILGIVSASTQSVWVRNLIESLSVIGMSVPTFWSGALVILVFSVFLRWIPPGGITSPNEAFSILDLLWHMIAPVVVLGSVYVAQWTRYIRAGLSEILRADYMKTAESKGIKRIWLILKHGLPNAAIPLITVLGLESPQILSGAVVTEVVFSWPGLGRLLTESLLARDYPVVMGVLMLLALAVVLANLLADWLYGLVDPRIRYE